MSVTSETYFYLAWPFTQNAVVREPEATPCDEWPIWHEHEDSTLLLRPSATLLLIHLKLPVVTWINCDSFVWRELPNIFWWTHLNNLMNSSRCRQGTLIKEGWLQKERSLARSCRRQEATFYLAGKKNITEWNALISSLWFVLNWILKTYILSIAPRMQQWNLTAVIGRYVIFGHQRTEIWDNWGNAWLQKERSLARSCPRQEAKVLGRAVPYM
jgi:hypothetical protein